MKLSKDDSRRDDKLRIRNSAMLNEFIHSNQGELILVGPADTAHTYIFARPRNAEDFPPDVRFVYARHEDRKFYLGVLEGNQFRCTHNSKFDESCESVLGAKYIVKLANNQNLLNWTAMQLYQSGKCARCGRALDSGFGLEHGFGKSCWKKHQLAREAEVTIDADFRSKPL